MKKLQILVLSFALGTVIFYPRLSNAVAPESKAESYAAYMMGLKDMSVGKVSEARLWFERAYDLDRESVDILRQLSQVSIRLGKLEDAEKWVEKALELEPNNKELLVLLAKIFIHQSKNNDAISALKQVISKNPNNEQALLMLGTLYAENHQWDKARNCLEKVAKLDGQKSFVAYYFLGRMAKEEGNYEKAQEYLKKSLEKNTFFTPALFELADCYEKEGKLDKAIDTYNSIILRQRNNLKARQRLLFLYLEQGNRKEVLKQIKVLKSLSQGDSNVLFRIALVLLQLDHPKDALEILNQLRERIPDNYQVIFYSGLAHEKMGEIFKARELYSKIPLDEKTGIEALTRRARILERLQQKKEAIALLKDALSKRPNEPSLYVSLSGIYDRLHQPKKAIEVLKEGISKNKGEKSLIMTLVMLLDKYNKKDEALKLAQKALKIDKEYVPALNYIAYTWAEQGKNLDEALNLAKKAVKLAPDDGYIVDTLGWVYFKRKDSENALDWLKKASTLVPNDPIIREHLGDVYFKRQEFKEAKKQYEISLKHVKNIQDRKRIRRKLRRTEDALSELPDY